MRLGISYNVFDDSIELLRRSISTVRNFADHISVIYQTVSNTGQPAITNIEGILRNLKEKGLIDVFILYIPQMNLPYAWNELAKRNLGLKFARSKGMSHFLSMDSDEFYLKDEFKFAKRMMDTPKFDASACRLLTYWKTTEYILDPPETYFVPFIYRITGNNFQFIDFPVLVDPTRRISSQNVKIFDRTEIEMHHLTAVRKDFRRKLENSTAIENFRADIDTLVSRWDQWKYPQRALMPGNPCKEYYIKKVTDLFNISYEPATSNQQQ